MLTPLEKFLITFLFGLITAIFIFTAVILHGVK